MCTASSLKTDVEIKAAVQRFKNNYSQDTDFGRRRGSIRRNGLFWVFRNTVGNRRFYANEK